MKKITGTVITLCGSTRFKREFEKINKELTMLGHVVISVAFFGHADSEPLTEDDKFFLDNIHLKKIDLSDAIYVINKGGYIGESTRREILHAEKTGKRVLYHEKVK